MNLSMIKRAGLTQQQFAELVGVSRVTVNTWVNKKHKPGAHIRQQVEAALQHISDMIRTRQLPIDREAYDKDTATKIKQLRSRVDATARAARARG